MEPIHQAAYDGDLAAINTLVEEDGRRLNVRVLGDVRVDGFKVTGRSPLMLAAYRGHDAVVARLIELGADVEFQSASGLTAVHFACRHDDASTLTMLLNAGASFDIATAKGATPLMIAAHKESTECVKVLLARGGGTLDLDHASVERGTTSLHSAAVRCNADILSMLLDAGADPTIYDKNGYTPFDIAHYLNYHNCISLLQAAFAEPQRPRALLKARALLDASYTVRKTRSDARTRLRGCVASVHAAPAYLKKRVAWLKKLPAVTVEEEEHDDEAVVASVKYALGLEGGGGWHEGEGPAPQGMLKEVFVELCEYMVPKWDRAHV